MKKGRGRGKVRGSNPRKGDKEVNELQDQQIHELGLCITDLPRDVFINILLRLSVKELLICSCVCKTWRSIIILDPEFAKLHFAKAEVYPLIQSLTPTSVSRTLYLLDPPPPPPSEYGSGYPKYRRRVIMKLDSKLKIPLRNAELLGINNNEGEGDANMNPPSVGGANWRRCIKLRPNDHKFNVVNSCNGLLCLSELSRDDPVAVCNPITGEYINLPVPTQPDESPENFIDCGLGFSPKTKQYQVIRMFNQTVAPVTTQYKLRRTIVQRNHPPIGQCKFKIHSQKIPQRCRKRMAEIYTLGKGSWKIVGDAPSSRLKLAFPTYLNGALHWLCVDNGISDYIFSFNFDNEQFQLVPPPPRKHGGRIDLYDKQYMSLGVLRGCLCICDASGSEKIKVWIMKEYGVKGSWKQEFRIDTQTIKGRWPRGLYAPINYLSNGAILLFHPLRSIVFYYNRKGPTYKFLKFSGIKSRFEVIAHVPSFISLKDTMIGDNPAVLNIKSRCAKFKLPGETEALFLEEIAHIVSCFNPSMLDNDDNDDESSNSSSSDDE